MLQRIGRPSKLSPLPAPTPAVPQTLPPSLFPLTGRTTASPLTSPEYCKRKSLAGSRQLRVRWRLAGDRPAGGSLRRKPHPPCPLTESKKSGRSFKKRPDLSFGFNEKRRVTAPRSWKRPGSPSKPSYPPAQSGKPHRLHPAWDWVLPSPQSSRSGRRAAPTYSYKRWGC